MTKKKSTASFSVDAGPCIVKFFDNGEQIGEAMSMRGEDVERIISNALLKALEDMVDEE